MEKPQTAIASPSLPSTSGYIAGASYTPTGSDLSTGLGSGVMLASIGTSQAFILSVRHTGDERFMTNLLNILGLGEGYHKEQAMCLMNQSMRITKISDARGHSSFSVAMISGSSRIKGWMTILSPTIYDIRNSGPQGCRPIVAIRIGKIDLQIRPR